MILEFCDCLAYKRKTLMDFFIMNMDHKMAFTPTSLGIRTIFFCLIS